MTSQVPKQGARSIFFSFLVSLEHVLPTVLILSLNLALHNNYILVLV